MKRIAVMLTATLWVPEERYNHHGALNMLAAEIEAGAGPAMINVLNRSDQAITNVLVSVELIPGEKPE